MGAQDIFMKMMFRKLAPKICETLMKASLAWGEDIFNLFITIRHDPKGDLDDPDACIYWIKSTETKNKAALMKDDGELDGENRDMLVEIFPIISEMIADQAGEWNLTSYDVFIKMNLKKGEKYKSPESLEWKILSNKGMLPVQKVVHITP